MQEFTKNVIKEISYSKAKELVQFYENKCRTQAELYNIASKGLKKFYRKLVSISTTLSIWLLKEGNPGECL